MSADLALSMGLPPPEDGLVPVPLLDWEEGDSTAIASESLPTASAPRNQQQQHAPQQTSSARVDEETASSSSEIDIDAQEKHKPLNNAVIDVGDVGSGRGKAGGEVEEAKVDECEAVPCVVADGVTASPSVVRASRRHPPPPTSAAPPHAHFRLARFRLGNR